MESLLSSDMVVLLGLERSGEQIPLEPFQSSSYCIFAVNEGSGIFHADFGRFSFCGPVVLFSTPLQIVYFEDNSPVRYSLLQFHSDFYCIEYHRSEVACNGILFNNIYIQPTLTLDHTNQLILGELLDQIAEELTTGHASEIVLNAYLQLFLARCSQLKSTTLAFVAKNALRDEQMELFRIRLEENFLLLHKPGDYSNMLAMSPKNFTTRCTCYYNKTPTQLIAERINLEAKKELH